MGKDTTEAVDSWYKKLGVIAILASWVISIGTMVWYMAATNTNYTFRLERIERELVSLDERLDTSEAYRMQIQTDLAQIKTDLLWIRRAMETPSK